MSTMTGVTGSRRFAGVCSVWCCLGLLFAVSGEAQEAETFFTGVTKDAVHIEISARSVVLGDYSNDGRMDVFLPGSLGTPVYEDRVGLWANEGDGRFVDQRHVLQAPMPVPDPGGGALFGDYDNDGDLDLFMGTWKGRDVLLRNDRGVFVDVTVEAGLTQGMHTWNAIWLDYDRDGHLDLYLGSSLDKLYRSNGDGTFSDVTQEADLFVQHLNMVTGGRAAGDFNDDGWPDLYVGVYGEPNRLFINDGQGGFWDATEGDIMDDGEAWSVGVGDTNNDGHLDIFQSSMGWRVDSRSRMFLNEGDGQFRDATSEVGLTGDVLTTGIVGAGMADIDNDGYLDLMTGGPPLFYLNKGDGTLVDRTSQSGVLTDGGILSFGDYDADGFVDVLVGGDPARLYRNNGNDNHWLRVELVGRESNRNGIGARLTATSGDLRQMRELLGGRGRCLDELVAHFGLGEHTRVDELEIHWPSGQTDVVKDIPGDQKIRVFEGREGYHIATPVVWDNSAMDLVAAGSRVALRGVVRPALFEGGAEITQVRADLSLLGGPSSASFRELGDGTYELDAPAFTVEGPTGWREMSVVIDQETSLGTYWARLVKRIAVVPVMDLEIYDEGPATGWTIQASSKAESDPYATVVSHSGSRAHAVTVQRPGERFSGEITYTCAGVDTVDLFGYTHLSFWIYPGDADIQRLFVDIQGIPLNVMDRVYMSKVDLMKDLELILEGDRWIEVRIPLDGVKGIESVKFWGKVEGVFYLDDMKLEAVKIAPITTSVDEWERKGVPAKYALSRNYPNPFNPETTLRYALPVEEWVTVSIYNTMGQRIRRLVEGEQQVGYHRVVWDGRDDTGQCVASGLYLCRMISGDFSASRKLVLMK